MPPFNILDMKNYLFLDINSYDTTYVEFQSLTWMMATTRQETSLSGKPIIKDYTIDINEKLYFLPGVSIPRVKLKDLYKDQKAKTVREIADATKVICGRKTLDTIADDRWLYPIKTECVKELIEECYRRDQVSTTFYDNMMEMFSIYTEDVVLGHWALPRCYENIIGDLPHVALDDRYYFVKDEHTNLYTEIKDLQFYDEDTLISIINSTNSTTIDKAMYDSLVQMFDSSDTDNYVLAMEIMANSNYNESLFYLCLLFKEYSHRISNQRTRNHVNFKALCSYMGFSSPSYCSMDIDEIVNIFIAKDLLTKEIAIDLLKEFKEEIGRHGDTQKMKIAKITFSDDVIEYLKLKEQKHEPALNAE